MGKTYFSVRLARFICPDHDRIIAVGPVPNLAVALGVPQNDLSTTDREAQEKFFRRVLDKARPRTNSATGTYPEGECLLAIDEADLYFTGGGRSYGSPALAELGNTGRNYFVSQMLLCRAPLDINRNARGLVSCMFIGHLAEPRTQEWFEDYTGIEGFGKTLRDFPPRKFIMYAPGSVPHVLGIAWAEGEEIVIQPWRPPESSEEEEAEEADSSAPPPTESSEEAPTPAEPVSTPGVTSPSPTSTSPGTAGDMP